MVEIDEITKGLEADDAQLAYYWKRAYKEIPDEKFPRLRTKKSTASLAASELYCEIFDLLEGIEKNEDELTPKLGTMAAFLDEQHLAHAEAMFIRGIELGAELAKESTEHSAR